MNDANINSNSPTGEPRQLDNELKSYIKKKFPSGEKIHITVVSGDGEAYNFAGQMKLFLASEGYRVDDMKQVELTDPDNGHLILTPNDTSDVYQIIIGHSPLRS